MVRKNRRHNKGTRKKNRLLNNRALLKRYPNLIKKLLGKYRLGGNELERLKTVSKLAINLLFDNANNRHLVDLKNTLINEETDVDTLIERVFTQLNLKVESQIEFSRKILDKILEIYSYNLSKEDLRDYHKQLREIVTNINYFEKNVKRQTKKDDRELKAKERQQERENRKELRELDKLSKLSLSK